MDNRWRTFCTQRYSKDDESSDDDDAFHPIQCPRNFTPELAPTDVLPFEPLHPTGQSLVGRTILYNWPNVGWCRGIITEWNSDKHLKVNRRVANFKIHYACDDTTAIHALSLRLADARLALPPALSPQLPVTPPILN